LLVLLLLISPGRADALEQTLAAPDGGAGDKFGGAVAIDGDTAVVGASGVEGGRGAVYVFTRTGDAWHQSARLTASDGEARDSLGSSVAIDGDTIVAGAPGDRIGSNVFQGSAYTFARTGPELRTETAKLTAAEGVPLEQFGSSVAIDGEVIAVAAPMPSLPGGPGSIYTFARTGPGTRPASAKLTASDGAVLDGLGHSVAIDGDTIVATAPGAQIGATDNQGAAYTFAATGPQVRTETAKLIASDGARNDFLSSVAIDGDTIVAGAAQDQIGSNAFQGSAYTFARTGAALRTETAKLTASDGAPRDAFGEDVAIDGKTIVAGAGGDDIHMAQGQGSAYTFGVTGPPIRTETAKLIAQDGAPHERFGASIDLDGDVTVVGAPYVDENGAKQGQGSATIFFDPLSQDTTPPKLTLRAKKRQRAGAVLRAKATSDEDCALVLSGKVATGGVRQRKLGRVRVALESAVNARLKLTPSPKLRRKLQRAENATATLKATCTDAAGNSARRRAKVRLRRKDSAIPGS
jgi:hypothetical protein